MLAALLLTLATGVEVEPILERLDRVASLYRDSALRFSCREKIQFVPEYGSTRTIEYDYMYVNDKVNGLHDRRTEVKKGGGRQAQPREVSPAELGMPTVVLRAYSAIFMFERSKRDNYRYELVGHEQVLGRDAVVIRFESIPPYKRDYNEWFGLAWVDCETSQLLKVDAKRSADHENQLLMEADLAGDPLLAGDARHDYLIESIFTEFGVEEHGMRFPSRVIIRRTLHEVKVRHGKKKEVKNAVHRVEQTYSNYSFYGVKTQEQIRAFVSGGAAPRGNR